MNENKIFVSYNPFAVKSTVSIVKNGQETTTELPSNLGEICYRLVSLCYANEAYNLIIHAPKAMYNEMEKTIMAEETRRYSNKNTKIKVDMI